MHWYNSDGELIETVTMGNGRTRRTTLADARKHGYIPSVTTIMTVVAKPQLERWKIKQSIMAALTLPRIDGESDEEWLKRIEQDSQKQAKEAAEEGTRVHDAISRAYMGLSVEPKYAPHVEAAQSEVKKLFPDIDDWETEKSFVSHIGFAGRVDLHSPSTGVVVDFKGKDGGFMDGKKMAYDQNQQLAAYQKGLGFHFTECANVFFSRTHPGAVASRIWSIDEIKIGWEIFKASHKLWVALKNFGG